MNLLAHALLSPADPAILTGNLTADWVKGRARQALPGPLQRGMVLHQRIDIFTDTHADPARCADLLAPAWGRYAPVLVDIFFDHVLSCDWPRCSAEPRDVLIARTYAALREHAHHLPEMAQFAVHALLADDWLTCYGTIDGIALSLTRLSTRLNTRGHTIELAPACADFLRHQRAFHEAFHRFWPELLAHVSGFSDAR